MTKKAYRNCAIVDFLFLFVWSQISGRCYFVLVKDFFFFFFFSSPQKLKFSWRIIVYLWCRHNRVFGFHTFCILYKLGRGIRWTLSGGKCTAGITKQCVKYCYTSFLMIGNELFKKKRLWHCKLGLIHSDSFFLNAKRLVEIIHKSYYQNMTFFSLLHPSVGFFLFLNVVNNSYFSISVREFIPKLEDFPQ